MFSFKENHIAVYINREPFFSFGSPETDLVPTKDWVPSKELRLQLLENTPESACIVRDVSTPDPVVYVENLMGDITAYSTENIPKGYNKLITVGYLRCRIHKATHTERISNNTAMFLPMYRTTDRIVIEPLETMGLDIVGCPISIIPITKNKTITYYQTLLLNSRGFKWPSSVPCFELRWIGNLLSDCLLETPYSKAVVKLKRTELSDILHV